MKNPLAIFTGAALATLAALAGLSLSDRPAGPPDAQKPAQAAGQAKDSVAEEASGKAPEQMPAAENVAKTAEKPTEMAAIPVPEPPKPEDQAKAKPELDTVRVESDGQAIVAGRAKPGAEIALKLGEQVIGKGLANSDGSWVVVPDQPLPKGAHEITIEQKAVDSPPVTAEQSIAVAVPEKTGQQAMVALTQPGSATKVLQSGGNQEQASLSETPQTKTDEPKPAETVEKPVETVEKPVETAEKPVETAEKPIETAEKPAGPVEVQQTPATTQKPAGGGELAGQASEPAPETTVAKIEVPDPVAPPSDATPAKPALPIAEQNIPLGLAAVDYNDKGDIIFSGRARPGTAVRLYVDNRGVGDAMVDAQGNWSFAGKDIIAPGTHDLRVDQIDKSGKVIARVELPFLRENAEAVAALNAPEAEKSETQPVETGEAQPVAKPPAVNSMEQAATEPAPQPAAEPPAQTTTKQPQTTTTAQPQTTTAKASPEVTAEQSPEASSLEPSKTAAAEPSQSSEAQKAESQSSGQGPGQPGATDQTVTTTAAAEQAAKAIDPDQPRSGKVVIQPGNNLWKLSRIIYGRGINFTVIYQANKEQIRNPNRIYPGQIFAIPGAAPPESIDPKRKEPLTSAEGGAAQ